MPPSYRCMLSLGRTRTATSQPPRQNIVCSFRSLTTCCSQCRPQLLQPPSHRRMSALAAFANRGAPQLSHNLRISSQPQTRYNTTSSALPSFDDDTIYALSTANGRAGIAVIRISGPACLDVYRGLCPSKTIPKPRYAAVRTLIDSHATEDTGNTDSSSGGSNVLDSNAIVLYFPAPKTVTGEDVLELHVHGGPATVKAVLAAIPRCASFPTEQSPSSSPSLDPAPQTRPIRYAEPGEFTKRAFLNARLDLAQVESLSDALSAETEHQRRAAVRGSSGALGATYDTWRGRLVLARGEIEALIDFSEDQHFDESPADLLRNVTALVIDIVRSVRRHEAAGARSELLRSGVRVALLGPPNTGKSSLMNLVVGREASIVSVEAGTTRDVVETSLDVRGFLCSFADTAGFRGGTTAMAATEVGGGGREGGGVAPLEKIGAVEAEGIRRARQKALESDIVVALASVEAAAGEGGSQNTADSFRIYYDEETLRLAAQAQSFLLVINKRDAVPDKAAFAALVARFRDEVRRLVPELAERLDDDKDKDSAIVAVSCKDAADGAADANADPGATDPGGIHALIDRLAGSFADMTSLPPDMQDLLGATERQRQLLEQCRGWLEEYIVVAKGSSEGGGEDGEEPETEPDVVLAAENLRYAAECLAKITGRGETGDVEEVLGVIFEKFCVGK